MCIDAPYGMCFRKNIFKQWNYFDDFQISQFQKTTQKYEKENTPSKIYVPYCVSSLSFACHILKTKNMLWIFHFGRITMFSDGLIWLKIFLKIKKKSNLHLKIYPKSEQSTIHNRPIIKIFISKLILIYTRHYSLIKELHFAPYLKIRIKTVTELCIEKLSEKYVYSRCCQLNFQE